MKKQLQSTLPVLFIVLANLTGYGQHVGYTFTEGGITYEVTALGSPNTVKITDNTNNGVIDIPSTVTHQGDHFQVTSIGNSAFADNQLTSVTLPNSVTSIGDHAFGSNPDLTTVVTKATVPPSLHADAFQNPGRNQIDLVVPKDALDVYNDQTNGWTGFRSITEPAEVGNMFSADHITYRVTSLAPYEVAAISYNTAGGGPSVNIPPTVDNGPNTYAVTAFGWWGFRNRQLTGVTIPNSVTSIVSRAFFNNQLTEVTIPDSVTSIGSAAFLSNQLTQVTIGKSVTSIGTVAFRNNPNLTTVVTKATVPPSLHADAFQNPGRNQIDVDVPMGKGQVYLDSGWTGFRSITEVAEVGDTFSADHITYRVTSLAPLKVETTGYNTAGGPSVTIPPTVGHGPNTYAITAIGSDSFLNKQLTGVTLPNSVTSIGEFAFSGNQLTSVTIPDGVTSIGRAAFEYNHLTKVTLGNSVTSIGDWAFAYNYASLTEVTLPNSLTSIGDNAFYYNRDLTTVVTKATVPPSLHADAFYYAGRNQIDLIVPAGTKDAYLAAGWMGFKSITEAAMAAQGAVAQRSGAKASTVKEAEAPAHSNQGNEFNDFTLYPNPARDKVHIDIDPRPGQELKQVNIYTMTGTHLYSENGPEINTSRLPRGTYLFEIVTQTGGRSMRRVIIQ